MISLTIFIKRKREHKPNVDVLPKPCIVIKTLQTIGSRHSKLLHVDILLFFACNIKAIIIIKQFKVNKAKIKHTMPFIGSISTIVSAVAFFRLMIAATVNARKETASFITKIWSASDDCISKHNQTSVLCQKRQSEIKKLN